MYSLALVACFSRPDRFVELVQTHHMRGSCDERVYDYMYRLTEALATALQVPFRFRDFAWEETYGPTE